MIRPRTARRSRFASLLLPAALSALLTAMPAPAQDAPSPASLRRENDALRERITALEAELDSAREQVEALGAEIEALRAQLKRERERAQTAPTPRISGASGEIPGDRFACPASLRLWLIDDYNRSFAGNNAPLESQVRHWISRSRLERATVLWDVRLLGWEDRELGVARLIGFDAESGANLCDQFTLTLSERAAEMVREAGVNTEWTIEGVFAAEPQFDAEIAPGDPQRLGAGARFGWTMTVRSFKPFDKDDPDRRIAR